MNNIPPKLRREMSEDPYYEVCCYSGMRKGPGVKIEWHHALIYAGKQVQEKWCILPLWDEIHDRVSDPEVKDKLDWIMLNRATDEELLRYSKAVNLLEKKKRLNKIYGKKNFR